MSALDVLLKSFSSAFDSIINVKIFYKYNKVTLLQAGLIVLLPQISAYLIDYNKKFGIKFGVDIASYPLLLFVFFVCCLYVLAEPRLKTKKADDVVRIALLSIHIFAFALSLNLIYVGIIQILGTSDIVQDWIFILASHSPNNLTEQVFSLIYGAPFILASLVLIFRNSFRRRPRAIRIALRSCFFWRSLALVIILALYQYMAFILVGASPKLA
jgi:hypothetical protein